MVEICHNILPEWENVGNTSKLIKVEKILEKLDKSKEEIEAIKEEVSSLNYIKEVLSIED